MNDKTREQIEAMKNQTIGVEIEMNNITREKAARKVAEYFGTRAWNAAGEYGYYSWACKDQQGRVWKFQRDVSIYGPDAEKCELVTPILTYDDIETLQEIIRLLRKAGAKSGPSRGCGVHIHIGKGDHTAKTIRNLVNIMAAHEQQIGRAIRIDAGRTGQYCQVVNHRFLDRLNREKPTTMRKLEDIWYEGNGSSWENRNAHYTGNYIWNPSVQAGVPDTILNRPYKTSSYVPEIKAGNKCMAFGDFSYYWVADRQGRSFKRLNELFAMTGQVGFLASQRLDGKLILPEAIKTLTIKKA